MSEHDRYFQEITRAFLARRGAPFFLSPKDLALIASWEKAGVPLAVVLDGLERAFRSKPADAGPRGRVLTLSFCQNQVRKLCDLRRDRRVGMTRCPTPPRSEKQKRARAAVEEFLASSFAADAPSEILTIIRRAKTLLEAAAVDEEALERLDEEADNLIKGRREKLRLPYFSPFYY